ncbi:collagen alpha-1(I) chain-like [Oryctolagus cuniculus]|uniref:collagen alpha-1(I) chain-like n=1 Tax=Oryctolagus cuniculus TaxID=9986 RepID=UPI003879A801
MLQRGGWSGDVPQRGAQSAAHQPGPVRLGGPRGQVGSRAGPRGALSSRDSGGRAAPRRAGATRQPHSPARLVPGLGLVLRTSETGDPLESPQLREAEKLPGVGREVGRAAAWGRGWGSRPARRCAGDSGVGRKPQPRAARRGSPRPPLQETRRSCGGAHAQTLCEESRPRRDFPRRRGGGGRRSTSGQLAWNSRLVLAQGQARGTTPRDGCQER